MNKSLSTDSLHKVQTQDRIKDRQGEVSAQVVRKQELIPWARNYRTIVKLIERDLHGGENILGARIEGEGRQRRYFLRAKGITNYVKKYGPAMAPKPKHYETKATSKKV